jgi:hypothetical protein
MSAPLPQFRIINKLGQQDTEVLQQKDKSYGSSWRKRGGIGAFMMLCRKWDRLEKMCEGAGYDIFQLIRDHNEEFPNPEDDNHILAQVRDLRRYLLLVDSWLLLEGSDLYEAMVREDSQPPRNADLAATTAQLDRTASPHFNPDGGPTALWCETWTPADINASDFGWCAPDAVPLPTSTPLVEALKLQGTAGPAAAKIQALQEFKDYVHRRLDNFGVPENPEPHVTEHTGCRIGPRLDWLFNIVRTSVRPGDIIHLPDGRTGVVAPAQQTTAGPPVKVLPPKEADEAPHKRDCGCQRCRPHD